MKKACIILPTYNEVENVGVAIAGIFEHTAGIASHEFHVLVVDDNSPDGTQDVVRDLMRRYPNLHLITGAKAGLGEAYKRGMAHAIRTLDPEFLFEMDADLQHPPELLPLFTAIGEHGFDMVIGSRFAPGGSTPNFTLYRRFLSRFGNFLIRFFGGLPRIHDCTSGYRCLRTDVVRRCDMSQLSTRGYSFQSSLLCEMLRNDAKVLEVPITFTERLHGASKLTLRDQLEFLLNLARIRFRRSKEFVKFCTVGASGVLVNMGIYVLLTRWGRLSIEIASPVAIEASILSNFALNTIWTFRHRNNARSGWQRLWRYHLVSATAGVANYLILLALVHLLGVWDILGNLAGIAVGTLINYSLNSLWTWKELRRAGATQTREPS